MDCGFGFVAPRPWDRDLEARLRLEFHAEAAALARLGFVLLDVVDARQARPPPQAALEITHWFLGAAGIDLDGAVSTVFDVAVEAQLLGGALHEIAEPNALDAAVNDVSAGDRRPMAHTIPWCEIFTWRAEVSW
jgi:hypothetical protein